MKKTILALLALLICIPLSAQKYELSNGQSIAIRLTSEIKSKNKRQPTPIAIVDCDIYDKSGEKVLIRRGTAVELSLQTQRAKGVGEAGWIQLECVSTTAVDGQNIRLIGGLHQEGEDRKGLAIGCGVGLGIVFFPVGICALCIKGEDTTIHSNTMIHNVLINSRYMISAE